MRTLADRRHDLVSRSRARSLAVLASLAVLVAAAGCSAPRSKHERVARELLARVRGTTVFGPASEYVPSARADVGASGMFAVRPPSECEIATLAGGEDSFAARMDLLRRAKQTIRIQALIFTGDESGLRVADVLKEKRREGVDVKIIVDAVNNLGLATQWMYFDLKQHGIEVEGYEALGLQLVDEIPSPFLAPFHERNPNQRYHEKVWIVDAGTPGAEAVTGGLNIANEYFRVDPANVKRYWRDQDVLVRGAVIDDLAAMFDRNWEHFKARRTGTADAAWETARALMQKTGLVKVPTTRREDLVKTVAALEARPVVRDYHAARCRWFQSRPRLAETYIQQAYLKLLDQARREVLIANAYFVPTPSIVMAVREAAARCVRVVLLSNGAETHDTPGMNTLARGYYREMLSVNDTARVKACKQGGVEIWEWIGKKPSDARQTQGLMHSKYAVVDREIGLVGSYNLDPRSERLNSESAIVYESKPLAEQLRALFVDGDLATSRRISADEAARFERPESVRQRLKKELAALFEDQY